MRKLLRAMAKAEMARQGYSKINRRMGRGQWRQVLKIVPTDKRTERKIGYGFQGQKRQHKGSRQPILLY